MSVAHGYVLLTAPGKFRLFVPGGSRLVALSRGQAKAMPVRGPETITVEMPLVTAPILFVIVADAEVKRVRRLQRHEVAQAIALAVSAAAEGELRAEAARHGWPDIHRPQGTA